MQIVFGVLTLIFSLQPTVFNDSVVTPVYGKCSHVPMSYICAYIKLHNLSMNLRTLLLKYGGECTAVFILLLCKRTLCNVTFLINHICRQGKLSVKEPHNVAPKVLQDL